MALEARRERAKIKALFSSPQKPKIFQDFLSHRTLRYIHGALNIHKNKK